MVCLLLLTTFENNQLISTKYDRLDYSIFAQEDEKDDDEKDDDEKDDDEKDDDEKDDDEKDDDKSNAIICNKLFDYEACENINESELLQKDDLTEEEEAIINRYMEESTPQQTVIDNSIKTDAEIITTPSNNQSGESSRLLNEENANDVIDSNQQLNESILANEARQTSNKTQNGVNLTQNTTDVNQLQLIEEIAYSISNANDIDINKVIQALNDLIDSTQAKGGNIIDSLKKIKDGISKNPSGSIANNIINIAKTK
jgi:hypothetical protein